MEVSLEQSSIEDFCLLVLSHCIGVIGCMMNNEASYIYGNPQTYIRVCLLEASDKMVHEFKRPRSGTASIILLFSCPGVCFILFYTWIPRGCFKTPRKKFYTKEIGFCCFLETIFKEEDSIYRKNTVYPVRKSTRKLDRGLNNLYYTRYKRQINGFLKINVAKRIFYYIFYHSGVLYSYIHFEEL